jgi:hypothetical protein
MEPDGSLPWSQESITSLYPEPDDSNTHFSTLSPKDPS